MKKLLRESLPGIISTLISAIILALLGSIFFNINMAVIVGLFLLLLVTAIYVLFSRKQSKNERDIFLPRFSKRIRFVIIIILIISSIFIFQSFRYYNSPYTIPDLKIILINNGSNEISIYERGEFFLTVPETPLSDTLVASGRIKLEKLDNNNLYQTEMVIPPKEELIVNAKIINPEDYRIFFEKENADIRLILYQKNGITLSRSGIPFDRNTFSNFGIVLETQMKKTLPDNPPSESDTNISKLISITDIDNLGKKLIVKGKVSLENDQYVLVFASGYEEKYYVGDIPAIVTGEEFYSDMEMGAEEPLTIKVIGLIVDGTSFENIKGDTGYTYDYLERIAISSTDLFPYTIK